MSVLPHGEIFEEDVSIRLVHVLMTCAEAVQRGNMSLAGLLIDDLQGLLGRVNSGCGIGKVGSFFVDALSRRVVHAPQNGVVQVELSAYENEILYHHYYEACPYLKFAHFTANQAILEAFDGHDCVHVIDFNLMQGLQWPALIQALALRPGGPPLLRLTGIGPPSPDGRDSLREIGLKLAELARSVNVRFAFRGVAATHLDDVKPWMLQVSPKEAVAVNSIMQLHKLLGPNGPHGHPIELVLDWIHDLNPKILMVVEQESYHNQPEFLDRFTEALYYYSTMFDSLDACTAQPVKTLAELYIQREICNVVCCEGSARVERHEPLVRWRDRLTSAGFRPLHLGSNAFKQARMLLTLFSAEGYSVEENEGCLTLGWHSPLIQALALRPGGPPLLRLTGIGPPSPDGRDSLREIGLKLAELARSVNVRFAFRGVAATRLDDVKPWMLQVSPKEAVAVNSIMQLHKLLGPNGPLGPPIELVLDWIHDLNPKILMVVEQESYHNQPEFLDRFTEALYYYSTMFDSLDACTAQPVKTLAELYIQREICNVVCCEGSVRVERHEPLVRWRDRLTSAGFRPSHLGSNAFKQARMLLTLFSAEGYSVEENEGCLTLGWHSRMIVVDSSSGSLITTHFLLLVEAATTLTGTAVIVAARTYSSAAEIVVLAAVTNSLAEVTTSVISLAVPSPFVQLIRSTGLHLHIPRVALNLAFTLRDVSALYELCKKLGSSIIDDGLIHKAVVYGLEAAYLWLSE
nr:hypothetical protein [Tanacetum cinerariifolium]